MKRKRAAHSRSETKPEHPLTLKQIDERLSLLLLLLHHNIEQVLRHKARR